MGSNFQQTHPNQAFPLSLQTNWNTTTSQQQQQPFHQLYQVLGQILQQQQQQSSPPPPQKQGEQLKQQQRSPSSSTLQPIALDLNESFNHNPPVIQATPLSLPSSTLSNQSYFPYEPHKPRKYNQTKPTKSVLEAQNNELITRNRVLEQQHEDTIRMREQLTSKVEEMTSKANELLRNQEISDQKCNRLTVQGQEIKKVIDQNSIKEDQLLANQNQLLTRLDKLESSIFRKFYAAYCFSQQPVNVSTNEEKKSEVVNEFQSTPPQEEAKDNSQDTDHDGDDDNETEAELPETTIPDCYLSNDEQIEVIKEKKDSMIGTRKRAPSPTIVPFPPSNNPFKKPLSRTKKSLYDEAEYFLTNPKKQKK